MYEFGYGRRTVLFKWLILYRQKPLIATVGDRWRNNTSVAHNICLISNNLLETISNHGIRA